MTQHGKINIQYPHTILRISTCVVHRLSPFRSGVRGRSATDFWGLRHVLLIAVCGFFFAPYTVKERQRCCLFASNRLTLCDYYYLPWIILLLEFKEASSLVRQENVQGCYLESLLEEDLFDTKTPPAIITLSPWNPIVTRRVENWFFIY